MLETTSIDRLTCGIDVRYRRLAVPLSAFCDSVSDWWPCRSRQCNNSPAALSIFSKAAVIAIDDALRKGEGLTVEFKRSVAYDIQSSVNQVLETIAAFANTTDGTYSSVSKMMARLKVSMLQALDVE